MAVIKRGVGFTSTEKNLAALADKIFLDLWTYPNLFGSRGKELCDLLVVCGDDVLVFSDKRIQWSSGIDVKLAWSRWYRESNRQVGGANQWRSPVLTRPPRPAVSRRRLQEEIPARLSHGRTPPGPSHRSSARRFRSLRKISQGGPRLFCDQPQPQGRRPYQHRSRGLSRRNRRRAARWRLRPCVLG